MSHTFEELKKKTVEELREIAAGIEHEAVKGYTEMNNDHLLPALCKALNIDMHAHQEVKGLNKAALKEKIKALRKKRDEVLQTKDHAELKSIRRKIHGLKRKTRRASV